MKIAIGDPGYLPGPEMFQRIGLCDTFIFLDEVETREDHTRTTLKTPQGRIILTVPIYKQQGQLLKDTKVMPGPWAKRHWQCMELAYKGCKWHGYLEEFKDFYLLKRWENLYYLNMKLIKKICKLIGFDLVKFERQSKIGDIQKWMKENDGWLIPEPSFVPRQYRQLHGTFVSNLSMLDFILNCGGRGKYDPRIYFEGIK